jgi:hypothetical protein
MLTADNPAHPEYLAMLACIDKRRDEKLRIINLEYDLKMDVLKRRAVAERAQIMSQFYQGVRETRETVLEQLGQEWYQVQHERRHHANNIPDYGIRCPSVRSQSIKHAIQYNKEVSILSGFAKHRGFPAAPAISGASAEQIEDDMEAINVRSLICTNSGTCADRIRSRPGKLLPTIPRRNNFARNRIPSPLARRLDLPESSF